jgi:hypothetical protein
MYRSFSDRSSWVVTFDQQTPVVSPPQLAFGRPCRRAARYTRASLLVAPTRGHFAEPCIQLQGVVLRSRLLRLTNILGCVQLSQFVQQFLIRLVIAHPGRSNSQRVSELDPSWFPDCHARLYLSACACARHELPFYSAVWAVTKVGLCCHYFSYAKRAYAGTWRWSRYHLTPPVPAGYNDLAELSRRCWIVFVYRLSIATTLGRYMRIVPEYQTRDGHAGIQCGTRAKPTSRELHLYTKWLEDFRPQHHSPMDTFRKGG